MKSLVFVSVEVTGFLQSEIYTSKTQWLIFLMQLIVFSHLQLFFFVWNSFATPFFRKPLFSVLILTKPLKILPSVSRKKYSTVLLNCNEIESSWFFSFSRSFEVIFQEVAEKDHLMLKIHKNWLTTLFIKFN